MVTTFHLPYDYQLDNLHISAQRWTAFLQRNVQYKFIGPFPSGYRFLHYLATSDACLYLLKCVASTILYFIVLIKEADTL